MYIYIYIWKKVKVKSLSCVQLFATLWCITCQAPPSMGFSRQELLSRVGLCNPMDCSPSSSSVHGDSPGEDTGVGCHSLLQGIFPTQRWNWGFLHCRQRLYRWAAREALIAPVVRHNSLLSPWRSWYIPKGTLLPGGTRPLLLSCGGGGRCWLFLQHHQWRAEEALTLQALTDGRLKPSGAPFSPAPPVHAHFVILSSASARTASNTCVSSHFAEWSHFPCAKQRAKMNLFNSLNFLNRKQKSWLISSNYKSNVEWLQKISSKRRMLWKSFLFFLSEPSSEHHCLHLGVHSDSFFSMYMPKNMYFSF